MILENFLKRADVPDMRRDISKPENVRWLVYNLGIRNSKLPQFPMVINELKSMMKDQV